MTSMSLVNPLLLLSSLALLATATPPAQPTCRPFGEIYSSGKDLCERIYSNAYRYVPVGDPEYDISYTMWFFTETNPNDAITTARVQLGLQNYTDTNVCWLKSNETFQKPFPTPENSTQHECRPWQNSACCYESTVSSVEHIDTLYGAEYRWDRCGRLSQACERFFVQEECLYECDTNIGLFRLYPPFIDGKPNPAAAGNEWIVYNMPIKGDYCDLWYATCKYDYFCGNGDFYECAIEYNYYDNLPTKLPAGTTAGIVIGILVIILLLVFVGCLIHRERKGQPVFGKIDEDVSSPLNPNRETEMSLQQTNTITTI